MAKKFISDDEMAVLEKPKKAKFISDDEMKTLESKAKPSERGLMERGETALQGAGQGLSLGYLPHLQALAEPALEKLYEYGTDSEVPDDNLSYVQRRDRNIKEQDALREEDPSAYLGGEVAGGLVTSVAGGGLLSPVAKGAGIGKRLLDAGRVGAAYGVAANPGDEDGKIDPLQSKERVKGAGIGAAAGVVGEGLLSGGAKAAEYVGKGMKNKAGKIAFKALRPYDREAQNAFGREADIGKAALENKVIGNIPRGMKKLAQRAGIAKKESGEKLGEVLKDVAKNSPGAGLSRKEIVAKMRKELLNPNEQIPGAAQQNKRLSDLISEFENGGDDVIPLLEAEGLKRSANKEINWKRLPDADIPLPEQVNRKLSTELKEGVESAAEKTDKTGKFVKAKKDYQGLSDAEKITKKRARKEASLRSISPSDYGSGAVGAMVGASTGDNTEEKITRGLLGASAGLLNKGARKYGNQIMSKQMDNAARVLMKSPQMAELALKNPAKFQTILNQYLEDKKK